MSKNKITMDDLHKLAPWAQEQVLAAKAESMKPKRVKKSKVEVNPAHWPKGKEKDFQKAVNEWLESIGFAKRNSKSIATTNGNGGVNGWQVHVHRAIGNPILLDVLLLRDDGQWLEFELKTALGGLSDAQALLIGADTKRVCRSMDEVKELVGRWLAD
jgi:hypothetical protein